MATREKTSLQREQERLIHELERIQGDAGAYLVEPAACYPSAYGCMRSGLGSVLIHLRVALKHGVPVEDTYMPCNRMTKDLVEERGR